MAMKKSGTRPARQTPRGRSEIPAEEEQAALDHVQVSGVGDVTEDGGIVDEDGKRLGADSASESSSSAAPSSLPS
jgi:hypothetical protein